MLIGFTNRSVRRSVVLTAGNVFFLAAYTGKTMSISASP